MWHMWQNVTKIQGVPGQRKVEDPWLNGYNPFSLTNVIYSTCENMHDLWITMQGFPQSWYDNEHLKWLPSLNDAWTWNLTVAASVWLVRSFRFLAELICVGQKDNNWNSWIPSRLSRHPLGPTFRTQFWQSPEDPKASWLVSTLAVLFTNVVSVMKMVGRTRSEWM